MAERTAYFDYAEHARVIQQTAIAAGLKIDTLKCQSCNTKNKCPRLTVTLCKKCGMPIPGLNQSD
jgi:hypothetical protein